MDAKSLTLLMHQPEHPRALLQGPAAFEESSGRKVAEGVADFFQGMSQEELAKPPTSPSANAWTHGFWLVRRADNAVIGTCGYKGPPDQDGVVEIAYAVAPGYRNRGYATEAAMALTEYAFRSGEVRTVRAHTLPEINASTRVLEKCGYRKVGEVIDPEDGRVWRWESLRGRRARIPRLHPSEHWRGCAARRSAAAPHCLPAFPQQRARIRARPPA